MTDPSDRPPVDPLDELVDDVLAQADEIAELDAARAEAWASDVLALAAERDVDPAALFAALQALGGLAAGIALASLAGLRDDVPDPVWPSEPPEWIAAVGTSRNEGAVVLRVGGSESIAFRFTDAADAQHVVMVDLVPGDPETVGEVVVGPGDLLEALQEDDAKIDAEEGLAADLAARCVAALRATALPTLSAVVNGRLLLGRLAALTDVDLDPPVLVEEDIPDLPARDPEDDAYALDVLRRALGEPSPEPVDDDAVAAVAAFVAPDDLGPFTPAERDAVLLLEWADWLGAVIGLVRAGEGREVDGSVIVDLVNRCPEVTTTIPKADRPRIAWAFDTVIATWPEHGLLVDGRLTERGLAVLPAALATAWS